MPNLKHKLLAIQKVLKPIPKDAVNPHFKNRYFDINSVLSVLRPILNELGLVVNQPLETIQGRAGITTIVRDTDSDESFQAWTMLPDLEDPQKMGAAITYFRRYALVSFFGMEAEDDDGNSAAHAVKAAFTKPAHEEAPFPDHPQEPEYVPVVPTSKACASCQKPFTPKSGWERTCYPCYALTKKA